MNKVGYLIIAIVILVVLLVVFFVSFILYRKTPVPKGCEELEINEEHCSSCGHQECSFYKGKIEDK